MRKFNDENIDIFVKDLEEITDKITKILDENENLSFEESENLSNLYKMRKVIADNLNEYLNTEDRKSSLNENENWRNWLKDFTERDKRNLERLDKAKNDAKSDISALMKKKALLIYTKK
ncbi:MAG: hypothetical protein ACLFR2_12190 [Candidatus Kapaibacterium sp.]